MTVFAQQAGYRFVNMIDRLTSDNYFLATSSRIPCSGKIRKARGHVGRESFWFPDGKALAGCCCRSKFSRLAPRRDYIADSISVSLALIIRQTKTRYTRIPLPLPHSFLHSSAPHHSFPSTLGGSTSPLFTNLSTSLLFLKRRGIVPLLPTNHREYHFLRRRRQVPGPEISIFHIQDFSSRSSARHFHSCLCPSISMLSVHARFFNLEKKEREREAAWK